HCCPHTGCAYRGWLGLGNVRANGHPNSGPWRQLHCTACEGYFLEHHGTLLHGKQAEVELIVRVLVCLAEGVGLRAAARVFAVEANTVLHWLVGQRSSSRPFPPLSCVTCTSHSCNLLSWMPCSAPSRRGRSRRPRRSNVYRVHPTGSGWR